MPYYQHICQKCKTEFEVFRKISEMEKDIICPNCDSEECKRLISKGTDFILAGNGWEGKGKGGY